ARTPEQLPALARAGVVDAGGRGLVVLLDALVEVVTGVAPPATAPVPLAGVVRPLVVARETGSVEYAYEVQYLLDADEPAVQRLRGVLTRLGDSLVIVGAGPDQDGRHTWNVHVHVNDAGAAIEAGVQAGRPHRIAVTRFADQAGSPTAPATEMRGARERGAVVVAAGPGLARLLGQEGAIVLSQTSPSTVEILDAVRRTGAGAVVILPNDPNVHAVASAAAQQARQEGIRAGVVPTRAPVQALAALAVRDPVRRFEDDLIAMAEAAGACRYAEVTTAAREAVTVAGVCQPGDLLALVEGEVNLIGRDLTTTCTDLLDRLLAGGGELVTLLVGAAAPEGLVEQLRAHLAKHWPFVEVQAFDSGQARSPLQVGVE
ncbi:MAG: Dak phosphatase, partial [Micromonosporaceae bacterium]|nr:Dak phosphatase [Micromonosporaceae bacterium]